VSGSWSISLIPTFLGDSQTIGIDRPKTMSPDKYTIIVGDQRFSFTRDQLQVEPGNYFDTYFFGDFQEAAEDTRELYLEKDPRLFTLIQAHLRGYNPFPIPDSFVPQYMTKEGAFENLLKDVEFFGLIRLEGLIKEEMAALDEREKKIKSSDEWIYRYWVRRSSSLFTY
jgi:hypothetical protein